MKIDEADRRFLWGLSYRLTGSAADADDLVQETMLRALERPPARGDELRPWLVRVAVNLGRDLLRKRKRRGYVGPWLPSPIEDDAIEPPVEVTSTEHRYDLLESVSIAFLLALEALTPMQRAVLLLCDVFDHSIKECARTLELTEVNVKVIHHRARKALHDYDASRLPRSSARDAETQAAFERLLTSMGARDGAELEALLAKEARLLSDGGGVFFAALNPILGARRIAAFCLGVMNKFHSPEFTTRFLRVNGAPALLLEQEPQKPRYAPRTMITCTVDEGGKIDRVYLVLAPSKLTRLVEERSQN
jgi:RNA polymerase sigma-70 factor (ECF subfamily)